MHVRGLLYGRGEETVVASNLKGSTDLNEADALEEVLKGDGFPAPEPTLPPHVTSYLGEQLQAFYAYLVSAPVPDRFVQLLNQLHQKGSESGDR